MGMVGWVGIRFVSFFFSSFHQLKGGGNREEKGCRKEKGKEVYYHIVKRACLGTRYGKNTPKASASASASARDEQKRRRRRDTIDFVFAIFHGLEWNGWWPCLRVCAFVWYGMVVTYIK